MSWLSKALKGVGKIAKKAAPIVGMIPGVGTPWAAALGGVGGLMSGEGWRGALKGALGGAAGGLATKIPGVGKLLSSGASRLLGGAQGLGGAIRGVGNQLLSRAGGVEGALGGLMGGGGGNPADLLMGGVNTFMNAQDATRNRDLENEQINFARQGMDRQRQMQDQIMGSLNKPLNVPNLGSVFADTSNPFYKPMTPPPNAGDMVRSAMGGVGEAPPNIQPMPSFPGPGGPAASPMPIPGTGGPALPPLADRANDVLRRLTPPPSGRGGGTIVPMNRRF